MIIYKATNKVNGKCYIGQTSRILQERIYGHRSQSKNKCKYAFHYALVKYGIDNFSWEILCECETKEELDEMEFHYIKQYHSHVSEYGYNMTWGGDSGPVMYGKDNPAKRPEIRKKLSEGKIGDKNPFYGKTHTDKYKEIVGKRLGGESNPLHSNSPYRKKSDNKRLKKYYFISPEGIEMTIIDMPNFCKEHDLNRHNMYATVAGKQSNHKGWNIKKPLSGGFYFNGHRYLKTQCL